MENAEEAAERVVDAVREAGVEPEAQVAQMLVSLLRPSLYLDYADPQPQTLPVGATRIGGLPDLPEGMVWPTWEGDRDPKVPPENRKYLPGGGPLSFVLQVNLAEAAPLDTEGLLPREGMLYCFAATWVNHIFDYYDIFANCPEQRPWRILYHPGAPETLRSEVIPPPLTAEQQETMDQYVDAPEGGMVIYKRCAVRLVQEWMLPHWGDVALESLHAAVPKMDYKTYERLRERISESLGIPSRWRRRHYLLGYAEPYQGCFGTERGGLHLLQLDTDHEYGGICDLSWDLSGRCRFFVKPAALAARDFSDTSVYWSLD